MDTTLIEAVGLFLLAGVARLVLGGVARLWTTAPAWTHHPVHAAVQRRSLPR